MVFRNIVFSIYFLLFLHHESSYSQMTTVRTTDVRGGMGRVYASSTRRSRSLCLNYKSRDLWNIRMYERAGIQNRYRKAFLKLKVIKAEKQAAQLVGCWAFQKHNNQRSKLYVRIQLNVNLFSKKLFWNTKTFKSNSTVLKHIGYNNAKQFNNFFKSTLALQPLNQQYNIRYVDVRGTIDGWTIAKISFGCHQLIRHGSRMNLWYLVDP